jgi:hypothetical protein
VEWGDLDEDRCDIYFGGVEKTASGEIGSYAAITVTCLISVNPGTALPLCPTLLKTAPFRKTGLSVPLPASSSVINAITVAGY